MQNNPDSNSRSPPQFGGAVTRAQTDPENTTAEPALRSGFGAVIAKEHALQDATERSVGYIVGPHATRLDRMLRHHHSRLGANIALLEQRYEASPSPERFLSWGARRDPPASPRRGEGRNGIELIPDLIGRHAGLLADIRALMSSAPDGQRGELILTEVGHNHEQMAWMLMALLKDDDCVKHIAPDAAGDAAREARGAEDNWVSDGGAGGR
jgi:hypothetical protein